MTSSPSPLTRRRAAGLLLLSPLAAMLAGAHPARAATTHQVSIQGGRFKPDSLTIKAGDTVVWTNLDGRDHTATARDKSWSTKSLSFKKTGAITFQEKGTHKYFCRWHPGMRGTITVS